MNSQFIVQLNHNSVDGYYLTFNGIPLPSGGTTDTLIDPIHKELFTLEGCGGVNILEEAVDQMREYPSVDSIFDVENGRLSSCYLGDLSTIIEYGSSEYTEIFDTLDPGYLTYMPPGYLDSCITAHLGTSVAPLIDEGASFYYRYHPNYGVTLQCDFSGMWLGSPGTYREWCSEPRPGAEPSVYRDFLKTVSAQTGRPDVMSDLMHSYSS